MEMSNDTEPGAGSLYEGKAHQVSDSVLQAGLRQTNVP